ncbi:MAG: DNA polymerase I [Thermoplasmata archaeon]|nr:MAG: DNA polymerase I [Thermoplasmata archaeon]
MKSWKNFKNRWIVDYEFIAGGGNPQVPICYVAQNIDTGETIKHWIGNLESKPLYSIDGDSLFIAYYASAEIGCHESLGFNNPPYIVDLFAEFRCLTNGGWIPSGNSLIGACNYYGISSCDAAYKNSMRDRILQGPPFSEQEMKDILDYCQKDVDMTSKLFSCMENDIDLPYALLRGRYMSSVAAMEFFGIPIDIEKLQQLLDNWDLIKDELIRCVDINYNVYDGVTFKISKFRDYLEKNNIPWDYTPKGHPITDNNYLRMQAKIHPKLRSLQELRYMIGQMKLNNLLVGKDGRNRCLLSPFRSITSRNQPSSSKFIFGNAIWLRNLIKPTIGHAISYIDYEQQEIAIAAALSDDENLKKAYVSGDPYLTFAKAAGAIPKDGTKKTHPDIREKYKICMLALNYGMATKTFAKQAGISISEAKLMVKIHKKKYEKYWDWSSNFIDNGKLSGLVKTRYNWYYQTKNAKDRTLMNWPMQSHGADILRLAISICIDNGIKVIAPVHDAILIEAPIEKIDDSVKEAQQCMEDASRYVLGFQIRTDAKTIQYPNHYLDPRGDVMWNNVWDIINSNHSHKKNSDKTQGSIKQIDKSKEIINGEG